jgi:hypothetical protein
MARKFRESLVNFKKLIAPPAPSSGPKKLEHPAAGEVLGGVPVSTENALGHPVEARIVFAAKRRYLEFISTIEDDKAGTDKAGLCGPGNRYWRLHSQVPRILTRSLWFLRGTKAPKDDQAPPR